MGSASELRGSQLAAWKRKQSERTREQLNSALDRFGSGKLVNLPAGRKLTRISFAKEAGVAEDTPFARYRAGHPKAGEYRFPEEVRRFEGLRKDTSRRNVGPSLKKKISELRAEVRHVEKSLVASRRVINAQDIKISELEMRIRDLEKLYSEAVKERNKLGPKLNVARGRGRR